VRLAGPSSGYDQERIHPAPQANTASLAGPLLAAFASLLPGFELGDAELAQLHLLLNDA